MARLTAAKRNALPASAFAGPNRSFPINDPTHAAQAERMTGRAVKAGTISAGTAALIKTKAKRKLGSIGKHKSTASRIGDQMMGEPDADDRKSSRGKGRGNPDGDNY